MSEARIMRGRRFREVARERLNDFFTYQMNVGIESERLTFEEWFKRFDKFLFESKINERLR